MRTALAAGLMVLLLVACSSTPVAPPHGAPELEDLLPEAVAGEPLEVGSRAGQEVVDAAAHPDSFEREYRDSGFDFDELRLAFASPDQGLNMVVVVSRVGDAAVPRFWLLLNVAGVDTDLLGSDRALFSEEQTIAGKSVVVGSEDLMRHPVEGRRPYLRETQDHWYVIVTDSEEWLLGILEQIP